MKSEENCRDWETDSKWPVSECLAKNTHCHNCGGVLIPNSLVNWHPDPVFKVCHKECRDGLPKPESKRVGQEIKQETNVFRSHLSKDAKVGYSVFGHHVDGVRKKWTADELSDLEEMWKEKHNGQWLYNMGEIADRLDRTEGAILFKIRTEKIAEKTGRCLPPSDKQLRYLKSLGYQEIPTCRKEAMEKIDEMLNKPTSTTFEAELRATGYDGSTPKTNKETLDAIWERQDPTENQINLLKRICAALGKEFEMPLNKLEASKTIDLLRQKVSSKQIRLPRQRRGSRLSYNKWFKAKDLEEDDGGGDEDYFEWNGELTLHETDDDKRGDDGANEPYLPDVQDTED